MAWMKKNAYYQQDRIFNMDALFLERINERLNELDLATIEGNQVTRYRILNILFIDTHFKYEEMVDKISHEFNQIRDLLQTQGSTGSKSSVLQHQQVIFSHVEGLLDRLHFKIVKLLYVHDLIYLKKKSPPTEEEKLKEIEGDY